MSTEMVLLIAGVLTIVSLLLSRWGGQMGLPGLMLFLGVGMVAGSEGLGLQFNDYGLAQTVGTVALALILFDGGLVTSWRETRPVLLRGLSLATLGVAITAGVLAAFMHLVFGWPWLQALLLGAIVSSTDASAVFSILKERALGLKHGLSPLLKFESGSNDPMAVFLTIGVLQLITTPGSSLFDILPLFAQQMGVGAALGYGLGRGALWMLNRVELQFEGLYSVLMLAVVFTVFSLTAVLGGSGFLAVYIAGLVLGNAVFVHKRSLLSFHDGLAWMMQVGMFLTLGLLVNPSELLPVAGVALASALALIFVARPISVLIGLAFAPMPWRERAMVSWVGLRGAVPIVLATFPLVAGVPYAQSLFNVVFFIVLVSVLLQGTTLPWMARLLKVEETLIGVRPPPLSYTPTGHGRNELVEVVVGEGSEVAGQRIMELDLPDGILVTLIYRNDEYVIPQGSTRLLGGDLLTVLARKTEWPGVESRFRGESA